MSRLEEIRNRLDEITVELGSEETGDARTGELTAEAAELTAEAARVAGEAIEHLEREN